MQTRIKNHTNWTYSSLNMRCDGAYYEAGYAYALGKEVMHVYDKREEAGNPLHFDEAQMSNVI